MEYGLRQQPQGVSGGTAGRSSAPKFTPPAGRRRGSPSAALLRAVPKSVRSCASCVRWLLDAEISLP